MIVGLESCEVCPRGCKVNRIAGNKGYCRCDDKIKVALVSIHDFEEPCVSGSTSSEPSELKSCDLVHDGEVEASEQLEQEKQTEKKKQAKRSGSGTIFFSNCNLNCAFCQNYEISQQGKGIEISIERLAEIMLEQQARNVNNINLVTPTMYALQIVEAIKIARSRGLSIPILYNSNGYESVETIKKLSGYIDVYLPDLKYFYDDVAVKYSKAPNYFEIATAAITEMVNQVGAPQFDENGIIQKGVIVRHLLLPNHIQNSKNVLKWLHTKFGDKILISVMAQYFPTYKAAHFPELGRKLNKKEYEEIENFVYTLGIENGFMQDLGDHEAEYVPNFDFRNVERRN